MKTVNGTEQGVVGSVLVVGGGIAGMQASLDLADQGFKVFLVEKQSAIGGKMAQLDKTFPTNDCAMCTISPRLVETARHRNISVLTNSEVLDVGGDVGGFTVRVRCEPRYIDSEKCVACGDCAEVCPVIIKSRFDEGLSTRRAAYKLYPQAVPNAFAIEKRGIAPCRDACPAGQRAQGYIALIREGRWHDALRVIKLDNPFPGICGRICNHRCESACNRALVDEAINIRALKRFITDKVYAEPREPVKQADRQFSERVAIIGAGPCGLTAAQDLALAGYPVTIFEAMPVAGGMLRLGVPAYRLPTEIIEREIQDILDLGIEVRLNHRVDDLDSLFSDGYAAVLIAVGAHEGIRLPIPGAHLEGVLVNTHFLRDVRLGKYELRENDARAASLGETVLVLGGGNVAIDCARSAIRLGKTVHLACLESRADMPAHDWEVQAAIDEGVIVHANRSFERIVDNGAGAAAGVACKLVESFHFDANGRLQVTHARDSEHIIACDTVIFSVGQRAGLAFIPEDGGIGITEQQTIAIDPDTLAATRSGVFAAGDSVSGTAFVIEAVASGHHAAGSIIRYLQGSPLESPAGPVLPVVHMDRAEIDAKLAVGAITKQPRVPMPWLSVESRKHSFAEIEGGYDDASAQREAARCLACGVCSECMSCTFACGVGAINHDMVAEEKLLDVGAIILAPGYQTYRAELSEEFGFGRYPNVVTSLQFERLLSASGPTLGKVRRPSDGHAPRRIAFLQCIGSRDQSHDYCSAICCLAATKEATIAKEHDPDLDIHVFFMDMRAFSKGYWHYFEQARDRYGIHFTRCRPSYLAQDPASHDLLLTILDDDNELQTAQFDMVVLSVGMEIAPEVRALGQRLGIELDNYGFCQTVTFNPVESSRPGIFAVGPFREPKDIPESVVEASGAAAGAASYLSAARFALTEQPSYPPERDTSSEEPRIGVFVCHCGSNIAGFLDVEAVAEHASQLANVRHTETNLYTCSQDSIRRIREIVEQQQLNRVVVASCTPRTHENLFRDSLRQAGLNPYLFAMANIRNHCSWVHSHHQDEATEKAKDLVRMAVARAAVLEPLHTVDVTVQQSALVVGGGAAGMSAALALAGQGFPVYLVEQNLELGGNLRNVHTVSNGANPQSMLSMLKTQVANQELIEVLLGSRVVSSEGFQGNFTTVVDAGNGTRRHLTHGATVLATGGQEYRGNEYGLGSDSRILTQLELEIQLSQESAALQHVHCVAMILCVGPAERYCGRICCSVALKNALALKHRIPKAQVVIFYRDIRTYGFSEQLYKRARESGIVFVRYDDKHRPEVMHGRSDGRLVLRAWDLTLKHSLELNPDFLVLSMPVVPQEDSGETAALFNIPLDREGFFQEAHSKLRPVDFNTGGIFMAGLAHYPKTLNETIIQAQAAAARAARVLSNKTVSAGGQVAVVDEMYCTGCLTCVRMCPFGVPIIRPDACGVGNILGAAYIEASVCQGCGICVSECPARAIQLKHYTDRELMACAGALVHQPPPSIALSSIKEVSP